MSALLKLDEDIYAVKHEMFEKGRDYLRALVDQYPGTINFSIGAGRIYRGLDTHLPSIAGLEDEREWLCRHLTKHAYQFAANELAQAVDLTLTISRNRAELAPPMVVEEGELFVAIDTKGAWHSVFLPPYHALADAREIAIACGLSVECRVINPGYHGLREDKGRGPFNATSNLPNRDPLNRFKDRLQDTEEKWPPPSFLAAAIEHGDAPHGPPEIGPHLPPEVVVAVSPYVANYPSHPEPKDEESWDLEDSPEPGHEQLGHTPIEPTLSEHATGAVARPSGEHAVAHPSPDHHPVAGVAAAHHEPTSHGEILHPEPGRRAEAAHVGETHETPHIEPSPLAEAHQVPHTEPIHIAEAHAALHAEPGHRAGPTHVEETPRAHAKPTHTAETHAAPHAEPTHTAEAHQAPHAEQPEHQAEAPHVEPEHGAGSEHAAEARHEPPESPHAEPAHTEAREMPHTEREDAAGPEHAETTHVESAPHTEQHAPVHVAEAQPEPAAHARAAQAPHATPQHEAALSTSEPQTELERREIKFTEKEELSPHVMQASFMPTHAQDAVLQASHAPAYVHLLDVPTHHHIYDAIEPQKKVAALMSATQPQVKVAAAPSTSPNLAPKIVPPPVPAAKSTPSQRRLTRAAFLKRLLAPGLTPMPDEEGPEDA